MKLLSLALLAASAFPSLYAHRRSFGPEISHRQYSEVPHNVAYNNFFYENSLPDTTDVINRFLKDRFQLSSEEYIIKNVYRSSHNLMTHVYIRQVLNGLEVSNGDMNVNIHQNGTIISFGTSFYQGKKPMMNPSFLQLADAGKASEKQQHTKFSGYNQRQQKFTADNYDQSPLLTPQEALSILYAYLELPIPIIETLTVAIDDITGKLNSNIKFINVPFAKSDVPVTPVYIQVNNGTDIKLAWDVELELEENWYHGQIDAERGEIHALVDWVADAQYGVYPIGINDPSEGSRQVIVNPASKNGSPLGWHDQGNGNTFTSSAGNNVFAQENLDGGDSWESNYRPDGGKELDFNFTLNLGKNPKKYLDAAITNLFYVNNVVSFDHTPFWQLLTTCKIHDLFYEYGFNEESGNFQENNFGKGGVGGDPVIANAQDGSG
jgi:extracellular elastinolytic metalloproteinase